MENSHNHENSKDSKAKLSIYIILDYGKEEVGV